MKKILAILLAAVLLLSVVGCNKTPPDVSDNTDKSVEQNDGDGQLLHPDDYDEFLTDIYLCDDVYRSDDTPTHGTASISLPMSQDVLELTDEDTFPPKFSIISLALSLVMLTSVPVRTNVFPLNSSFSSYELLLI